MAADERPIDDAVVEIKPSFRGFRQALRDGIARSSAKLSIKVPIEADTRGLRRTIRDACRELDGIFYVRIRAELDNNSLRREAKEAAKEASAGTKVKVDVELDDQKLKLGLKEVANSFTQGGGKRFFAADLSRSIAQDLNKNFLLLSDGQEKTSSIMRRAVNRDQVTTRAHASALQTAAKDAENAGQRIRKSVVNSQAGGRGGQSSNPFSNLVRQAFDAAGKLKILDFGAKGIRPVNLLQAAVAGLTPVLFSMAGAAVQASAAFVTLGAGAIGAVGQVTAITLAFSSVVGYIKQFSLAQKASRQAAATAAAGTGSVSDAAVKARDAAWALADANKQVLDGERALHTARIQATRDLEDMIEKVVDLKRQQKHDKLDVKTAKLALDAVKRNFFASPEEVQQAQLDYEDALNSQSDTNRDLKRTKQDLGEFKRNGGVEGSDAVRGAKDQITAGKRAQITARDQAKGAGSVKPASAATQLKYLRSQLSPAAREFADFIDKNATEFTRLRKLMETAVLPGFLRFLKAIMSKPKGGGKSTLTIAAEGAAALGGIVGNLVGDLGKLMKTKFFRNGLVKINGANRKSFQDIADTIKILFPVFWRLFVTSAPQLARFTDWIKNLATKFSAFVGGFKDADLVSFFQTAGDTLVHIWKPFEDIIVGVWKIFAKSMPTGDDLWTRFGTLTQQFRDWASSAKGQEQIKDFFKKVQDIDYKSLSLKVAQMVTLVGLFKTGKIIALHPFATLLGLLAAQYPAETAKFLETTTRALTGILGFVSDHPKALTGALALVSAYKGLKVLNGVKLPGMPAFPSLPSWLGGKLGAAATVAEMTVTAGTVFVNGAVGGTTGGPGAVPIGPDGKPKPVNIDPKTGKPVYIDPKTGRPTLKEPGTGFKSGIKGRVAGGLAVAAGAIVGNALLDQLFGDAAPSSTKGQFKGALAGALNGAAAGAAFGPLGIAIGALVGTAVAAYVGNGNSILQQHQETKDYLDKIGGSGNPAAKDQKQEGSSYAKLLQSLANGGGSVLAGSAANADKFTPLQNYINDRRTSVTNTANAIRNATPGVKGMADATKFLNDENLRSRDTLSKLLQSYGYTRTAADKYAAKVYGVRDATTNATASTNNLKTAVVKAGGAADTATGKFGVLKTSIDQVTGKKVITVTTPGITKVFNDLTSAVAYQDILRTGAEPTTAKMNQIRNQILNKNTFARGGPVWGAGTATSDSIPAMLSHGEYVMPAKIVKHYGLQAMDAMRQQRLPEMYAKGGPVTWPFPVRMPTKAVEQRAGAAKSKASAGSGAGAGPGGKEFYVGKIPRGLGAVSHLTKQMFAAVLDAHNKFPWETVTSGFRKNSITVTGNRSYHGFGRATDWLPSKDLFNYFKGKYGASIKELIYSPMGNEQVRNGKPHFYTGAVRATHFNHVHLALAKGGAVKAQKYDTGGGLKPGLTLAYNGTGQTETVRTAKQEKNLHSGTMRLDKRDIHLLAAAIASAASPTVHMDGRKVAEVVNRHQYLPAGI